MALPKILDFNNYNRYPDDNNPTTDADMQDFLSNQNIILTALSDRLWQPETLYNVGDIVASPSMPAGLVAVCVIAGATSDVEPAWTGNETTVVDNYCTWEMRLGYSYALATEDDIQNAHDGQDVEPTHLVNAGVVGKIFSNIKNDISNNFATQAEAETGTNENKFMSPVRVAQAIKALASLQNLGVNATAGEINQLVGVSSNVQQQIDNLKDTSPIYPAWWTMRGDGSDGDFTPTDNITISGIKNYKNVVIKEGVTVTVDKYVFIKCQETFLNNGVINGNGKGVQGSTGVNSSGVASGYLCYSKKGNNGTGVGSAGVGGSSGLPGGLGSVINEVQLTREQFTDVLLEVFHGIGIGAGGASGQGADGGGGARSYGGKGGAGGAAVVIVANTINNQGVIQVDGTAGAAGWGDRQAGGSGGGGAGGTIVGIANSIIARGETSVQGGGSNGSPKGGTGEDGIVIWKELGDD